MLYCVIYVRKSVWWGIGACNGGELKTVWVYRARCKLWCHAVKMTIVSKGRSRVFFFLYPWAVQMLSSSVGANIPLFLSYVYVVRYKSKSQGVQIKHFLTYESRLLLCLWIKGFRLSHDHTAGGMWTESNTLNLSQDYCFHFKLISQERAFYNVKLQFLVK